MLGSKLKALREERELTQREVADKIGCSYKLISNYELEKRAPDYQTLVVLSDLYEVTVDYLLGRVPNSSYHFHRPLTKQQIELLTLFSRLPEQYKADVIRFTKLNLLDVTQAHRKP
jgi:transcriptional regulator with XRE-family HTH domain